MSRFHIVNFGCRANQADGAVLEQDLLRRGFEGSDDPRAADVIVLNSCTVTASADYDLRHAIRRTHRDHPSARIWVTGCYAQRNPEEIAAIPGVDCVVGNSHKHSLGELI